jgi:hypothetical protein
VSEGPQCHRRHFTIIRSVILKRSKVVCEHGLSFCRVTFLAATATERWGTVYHSSGRAACHTNRILNPALVLVELVINTMCC